LHACKFPVELSKGSLPAMKTLRKRFTAPLQISPNRGGWTYVVMPGSAEYFKTRGLVKVKATVDGLPFRVHLWPSRARLGKRAGDSVTIRLIERFK
jgi:hypothetical protein